MTQNSQPLQGATDANAQDGSPAESIRETNTPMALAVDRLAESIRKVHALIEDHRRLLQQTTLTMRGLNDQRAVPDDSRQRALMQEGKLRFLSDEPAWMDGMSNTVRGNPNDYEPALFAPTLELP